MKSVTFQVPMKPVSLNHSHEMRVSKWVNPKTGKRRIFRAKKKSTEDFEKMFEFYLRQLQTELKLFAEEFDPTKNAIHVDAYFYINKEEFFTKPKSIKNPRVEISRHSLDLDNCLKIAMDSIFGFLGIDDKHVTYINAQKIPCVEDKMIFKLALCPFPSLGDFSADHLSNL